jgi:hypothetical protein
MVWDGRGRPWDGTGTAAKEEDVTDKKKGGSKGWPPPGDPIEDDGY